MVEFDVKYDRDVNCTSTSRTVCVCSVQLCEEMKRSGEVSGEMSVSRFLNVAPTCLDVYISLRSSSYQLVEDKAEKLRCLEGNVKSCRHLYLWQVARSV